MTFAQDGGKPARHTRADIQAAGSRADTVQFRGIHNNTDVVDRGDTCLRHDSRHNPYHASHADTLVEPYHARYIPGKSAAGARNDSL